MRRALVILALIVGMLAFALPPAEATTPAGPICFSTSPFIDIFVWFFDTDALGNQIQGTGRNLTPHNTAQALSLFISGTDIHWVTSGASSDGFPILSSGTLDTTASPISGPAFCHRVNSAAGCGTGSAFTLSLTDCPPDAALAPLSPSGPGM